MNHKLLGLISITFAALLISFGSVSAATIEYKFTFTGADMLNNVFVDGSDGSSAADNDLYEGARLLREGSSRDHVNNAKTFIGSEHNRFNERWNGYAANGYVFDEFNLWGLDGNGIHWGEDFKPIDWYNLEGPEGWSTSFYNWTALGYGTPPVGARTLDFPRWFTGQANALGMEASNLSSQKFSFVVKFDTDDMFYGADTKGEGNDFAPNELPELTFWFGGWLTQFTDTGEYADYHMYEGNMILTGSQVPEPATMLLFGVGLLGIAGVSRRKRA